MYLHSKFHENWVTRLLLPVVTRRLTTQLVIVQAKGRKTGPYFAQSTTNRYAFF